MFVSEEHRYRRPEQNDRIKLSNGVGKWCEISDTFKEKVACCFSIRSVYDDL